MAKRKKREHIVRYDTDRVAKNLLPLLLRDFRGTHGQEFGRAAEEQFAKGITQFRDYEFPEIGVVPPSRFKRWKQIEGLYKKYRFRDDKYTDEELQYNTLLKFFKEQERISTHQQPTQLCYEVLQRARKIASGILGKYSPEETIKHARFGKKSSIGCPLAVAYIDEKLSNVAAFTSSSKCAKWFFKDYLPGDPLLKKMLRKIISSGKAILSHEFLKLVLVPKTWKKRRPITPLTLIALFYSYGVGTQVENCLRLVGLDIKRLQQRHRRLVKAFSMSKTHATADLRSASDSLTSELLNRVLPRKWFCAIQRTFCHQLIVGDKTYYTASVLPMGNGLTFPVETLVFYSIVQAVKELTETKAGFVSVYGDDLIYPSSIHPVIAHVFPRIGLVLNLDKTFVQAPFRESCGSDYYQGVDVRPFFLSGEHCMLTRTQYLQYLYKTYNGLTRRWDPQWIKSTLFYLLTEIAQVAREIYRVPVSFPDTAGIKVHSPLSVPLGADILPWSPIRIVFTNGSIWHLFRYFAQTAKHRAVKSVYPYYWLALQGRTDDPIDENFWDVDYSLWKSPTKHFSSWRLLQVPKWKLSKNYGGKRKNIPRKYQMQVPSSLGTTCSEKMTEPGSVSSWT